MKNKKTLILSIVICVVGAIVGLIGQRLYRYMKFESIYNNLLKEGSSDVIFLGRPTCGFCTLLTPILEDITSTYHIEYRYINVDNLTKKQLDKLLKKLNIRKSSFSTPRLIITDGTTIKDQSIGYIDDISLFHYFQKNGLIKATEKFVDPYPNVVRMDGDTYFTMIEEKQNGSIIIGRIGDSTTNQMLKKANDQKENYYFLNLNVFEKEQIEPFKESIPGWNDELKLPILLEMKQGKVVKLYEKATVDMIDK